MIRLVLISLVLVAASACGVGTMPPSRAVTSSQALTGSAEWLEFEPTAVRQGLYRDIAHQSQEQAGRSGTVLFPMTRDGQLVAAPALDAKQDLLQAPDAGAYVALTFDTRGDSFGDDRREAYQGLSEREATELVARSLLHHWGVRPSGPVVVLRSAGAPWAAAYVDGVLSINPSFVTVACAALP